MTTVIRNPNQVTTTWLTQVLRKSGDLTHGTVMSVQLHLGYGNWSSNARLCLTYSRNATGHLPRSVFLKLVETDSASEDFFDDSEVRYYLEDYIDVADAPLLRCYEAAYDQNCYHLLLEDVSTTHQVACSSTPDLHYGCALAKAVAVLHTRYWATQHSVPIPTEAKVERYVKAAKPGLEHVLNDPKCKLKPHWPELLYRFMVVHPRQLLLRLQTQTGFTLVHGDLNGFNILVPKCREGQIYLIDRQPFEWSLTIWLGVSDLAFVMISDWTTKQRRDCEVAIIRQYYLHLQQLGVTDYEWDQVWRDYQLCLVMGIYKAIEFCKNGVDEEMRGRWQSLLERSVAALEDFPDLLES